MGADEADENLRLVFVVCLSFSLSCFCRMSTIPRWQQEARGFACVAPAVVQPAPRALRRVRSVPKASSSHWCPVGVWTRVRVDITRHQSVGGFCDFFNIFFDFLNNFFQFAILENA